MLYFPPVLGYILNPCLKTIKWKSKQGGKFPNWRRTNQYFPAYTEKTETYGTTPWVIYPVVMSWCKHVHWASVESKMQGSHQGMPRLEALLHSCWWRLGCWGWGIVLVCTFLFHWPSLREPEIVSGRLWEWRDCGFNGSLLDNWIGTDNWLNVNTFQGQHLVSDDRVLSLLPITKEGTGLKGEQGGHFCMYWTWTIWVAQR